MSFETCCKTEIKKIWEKFLLLQIPVKRVKKYTPREICCFLGEEKDMQRNEKRR